MLKRFLPFVVIALCLSLVLSACGGKGEENAPSADSSDEFSNNSLVNPPVTDESINTDGNSSNDSSIDYSDLSNPPSEDNSQSGNNSVPEIFLPDSTADEAPYFDIDSATTATVNAISKNGVSYRIAYTKENPTSAKKCVTHPEVAVTAIFDGSTTRFFDAVTGEYYTILVGDYCIVADNGVFTAESGSKGIRFTRAGAVPVWEEVTDGITVSDDYFVYWSESYTVAYTYKTMQDGSVDLYAYSEDSYVPCISNGNYGIVNNGKVVVDFEYDYIESYQGCAEYGNSGTVGVFRAVKGGKVYYISSNGSVLTPEGYTCGSAPYGNRAWVFNGDYGFVLEFN